MKKLKKLFIVGAVVLTISAVSFSALAVSGYGSPTDILAGLTGQTSESITAEKVETGVTYGSIASDYGVLDEFKAQLLDLRKAALAERVAAGTMTQEQADLRIANMEANQAVCDGTGIGGSGYGAGNGTCSGTCDGTGVGAGGSFGGMKGSHNGGGQGSNGVRNGSQGGCSGTGICTSNVQN